ncbi:putative quinol monooxygenase [Bradyrhizobium sp. USDA 336]|uniref:putative quinol monooxygenase n=1 Tax=Bradyrhizobium sp. USDA 336 TaxID=3156311 RepID=UPI003850A32B
MSEQARASLERGRGCSVFDICVDSARADVFVLYGAYDDAKAFKAHLASDHYKSFAAEAASWMAAKNVSELERMAP